MSAAHDTGSFTGPYRGLEPFDEASAAFFFGRERETRLVTASLFAAPLTLLYGASGVGKSSVLRAGVLRHLRQRTDILPVVFPRFSQASVERGWQTDPVSGIKETAALELFESAAGDAALLRRYRDAILAHDMSPMREFFDLIGTLSERRLMIILDQFEEYSLYHPDDDLFAEQFPRAITTGSRSTSFLLSLREDALGKLDRFKGRIPTLWDSYRRIDHLDGVAAEDAIRLPLREYNRTRPAETPITIEDSLVDQVLRDVQAENVEFETTGTGTVTGGAARRARIETPYLQLVMTRLWERELAEGSTVLRHATLVAEKGAAQIVLTHLDRVMEQFKPEEQDIAARVFHRLVTPTGSKIAFSVRDLAEYETLEVERLAPILSRLEEGSRRILRRVAARGEAADVPRYEIFHDRLGRAILAWRTKHLAEQGRAQSLHDEAEKKRLAEEGRATLRAFVDSAIEKLDFEDRTVLSDILFYLVSSSGHRLAQETRVLASLARLDADAVARVLERLASVGIVRRAFTTGSHSEPRWEVAHDQLVAALLEWHSRFVVERSSTAAATEPGTEEPPPPPPAESRATREFPYQLVAERLMRGQVLPFLGAGSSLSGHPAKPGSSPDSPLPTSRELKEFLARESDFPLSELEHSNLAEIASYYSQRFGRLELEHALHKLLARDSPPSATHRYLADVCATQPLVILTTNYDTLLEQALVARRVSFHVLAYSAARQRDEQRLTYFEPSTGRVNAIRGLDEMPTADRNRTQVVRLYGRSGAYANPSEGDEYVVTEEDHMDWIYSFQSRQSFLRHIIAPLLNRRHLLSLGHSAQDWSQRVLLRELYSEVAFKSRRIAWAVALRPGPLSVMTWQRYSVEPYNADLNDWVVRMREATPGLGGEEA